MVMSYLRSDSGEGETVDVLVEDVGEGGILPATGEQNAGLGRRLRDQAGGAVTVAQSALRRAVSVNARAFLAAARALDEPPDEMEITFGLKVTGEAGNVAVGKVAGESNYQVRMVWKRPGEGQTAPGRDGVV
jgi:hypothetical protein